MALLNTIISYFGGSQEEQVVQKNNKDEITSTKIDCYQQSTEMEDSDKENSSINIIAEPLKDQGNQFSDNNNQDSETKTSGSNKDIIINILLQEDVNVISTERNSDSEIILKNNYVVEKEIETNNNKFVTNVTDLNNSATTELEETEKIMKQDKSTVVDAAHESNLTSVDSESQNVVNHLNTSDTDMDTGCDITNDSSNLNASTTIVQVKEEQQTNIDKDIKCDSNLATMSPVASNNKITKEMMDEEEKCMNDDQKCLEEIRERARKELERTGKKQRYDRLQLLLDRSQMYATYLLGRLDSRKQTEEKLKERQLKKGQNKEEKKEIQQATRRGNRNRKQKVFHDDKEDNNNQSSQEKKEGKKRGRKTKRKAEEVSSDSQSEVEDKSKKQKMESKADESISKEDTMKPITPSERYLNGEKIPDRQPLLLTGAIMREYQLDGLEWLRGLFEHGINGILADEMGLGKTIQSISLVCSLIEQRVVGPFLVAAPLSTLPNWISEFKKFAPEVHTILYHGSPPDRARIRRKMMRIKKYNNGLASLPVVISSYEILMRDRPLLDNYNIEWKYLIVDEGHRIKNLNCRLIKELKLYRAANRLLLTGTPLQNNLSELWSLLNFLLPDIFDDLNSFQRWFDFSAITDKNNSEHENNEALIAQEEEGKVLQTLHSILTPFLLRRLKTDVDLSIPPKKEVLVYAPLTEKQQEFYRTTLDRTILDTITQKNKPVVVQELTPSGRPKRKSTNLIKYTVDDDDEDIDFDQLIKFVEEQEKIKEQTEAALLEEKLNKKSIVNVKLQNIMMQLRKCCNHPYLLEYPFNPKTEELIIDERLIECSGKMLMLNRMLPVLRKQGHKMTLMLDILGDYCQLRNYTYSRIDGTMNIQLRQENIEKFTNDPNNFIFLLSTRSGGLGLNLMMADTCIIYDSDWNPQVDLQAQDRCHRIGQKKPVVIYRLVTANTVDQKIIERAANKRKLEKMIIHKKNFKGRGFASAITPQELVELLKSTDATVNTGNIISDEGLKQLLDRSDMENWDKKKTIKNTENEDEISKKENIIKMKNEKIDGVVENVFKVLETNDNDGGIVF